MSNIRIIIEERPADIGNFLLVRLLPFRGKRMVKPFIFIDHMGPTKLNDYQNLDMGVASRELGDVPPSINWFKQAAQKSNRKIPRSTIPNLARATRMLEIIRVPSGRTALPTRTKWMAFFSITWLEIMTPIIKTKHSQRSIKNMWNRMIPSEGQKSMPVKDYRIWVTSDTLGHY